MGFGNPYGDPWNVEICQKWVDQLASMNIKFIALSDTIGVATPESIAYLFGNLIPPYPDVEFGAHLHTRADNWRPKIEAAYNNGCFRFDGAIKGFGGCPMAKDELTGNMPTENIISFFDPDQLGQSIDRNTFAEAMKMTEEVFP
jgi:hydroxymethylglutaryl-CoA lyase